MPLTRIIVTTTGSPSYDAIRTRRPLAWPGVKQALWDRGITVDVKPFNSITVQELQGTDHLVLHGVPSPNCMNILRKLPCRFSCFQDDLMFVREIPKWNPNRIAPIQEEVLKYVLEHAAAIVATTEPLAAALGYPEKTRVQGNLEDFPGDGPPEGKPDRMEWCAFVGGNSHSGDLELLNGLDWPGRTVIWSSCLPSARTAMYRNRQGCLEQKPDKPCWGWIAPDPDYEKYRTWLDNLGPQIGIGLAPLIPCAFNACKSLLKWIEYTRLGWVTVCSDTPPYSCIPDGCCVKVGPHDITRPAPRPLESWTSAVTFAASSPTLAQRAWDFCRANFSYQENWRDWVELWSWIAGRTA